MNTFPHWIKRPMPVKAIEQMNQLLKAHNLHTVCQSAHCPNIGECFQNKEATFMILGNICTRSCSFCSVKTGIGLAPDKEEPHRIAQAVKELGLEYVVITSVTRDDIRDAGAGHFADTIKIIRYYNPNTKIEVLTPDFKHNIIVTNIIISARPDVFSHNIETVPMLYNKVRPKADYQASLAILKHIKNNSDILTKSGIILGLGETEKQVIETLEDLKGTGCDILTIGQYLKPSSQCADVAEFILPEKFQYYKEIAKSLGFAAVKSGSFVRSSYRAKEAYREATNECSYA